MTNAELNAKCAEIMGWKIAVSGVAYYDKPDGSSFFPYGSHDWNPCENIAQAFEVAEKITTECAMEIWTYPGNQSPKYNVRFFAGVSDEDKSGIVAYTIEDSLPLALTKACVAAFENKEKV